MALPPIIHHPAYVADLPDGHRFPMQKFGALMDVIVEERLVGPGGAFTPILAPEGWLTLAHDPAYVSGVLNQTLDAKAQRRIGFPVEETVARRSRAATAGTVLAARLALEHGIACNTAGGSHHADTGGGAGFCVFNDVSVAIRVLQADSLISRALVVDLDVHQGDGTARIFEADDSVVTYSVHAADNYPARKANSDHDIALPDGVRDEAYLEMLHETLPKVISTAEPDIILYNAGVDPHQDDKLGRLSLSDVGLAERDRYVLSLIKEIGLPVACVIGGGYADDVGVLARRHATLHRAAAAVFSA